MTPHAFIFDLDGTLVDSAPGILSSFKAAFDSLRLTPKLALNSDLIGPSLRSTKSLLAGNDEPFVIEPLIYAFQAHYDTVGYKETTAYPRAQLILNRLAQYHRPMFIATNKRKVPTDKIIEYLNWRSLFEEIYSVDSIHPSAEHKADLICHILSVHGLSPSKTLYIGDRREDFKAAEKTGVKFFHTSWGYESTTNCMPQLPGEPYALIGSLR